MSTVTSPESFGSRYVKAIELNNSGVELLKQGDYSQASVMFGSAISVMKSIYNPDHPTRDFIRSSTHLRSSSPKSSCTNRHPQIQVEPVSRMETFRLQAVRFDKSRYRSLVCPVHLVGSPFSSSRDAEYDTAVLLFNQGVAFFCASSCTQITVRASTGLLRKAEVLLRLSASFLLKKRSQNQDIFIRTSTVVLHSLVQVLTAMNATQQAQASFVLLSHVMDRVKLLDEVFGLCEGSSMKLAPAA